MQHAELNRTGQSRAKVLSKVRPKSGPKRAPNPHPTSKNPVKQANRAGSLTQKRVKNEPQKRHQNPTQKSTKLKSTKIDEKPQNRRKSTKTGQKIDENRQKLPPVDYLGPKKPPRGYILTGRRLRNRPTLGSKMLSFMDPFYLEGRSSQRNATQKKHPAFSQKLPRYIYIILYSCQRLP
jgi:hypothetical protein